MPLINTLGKQLTGQDIQTLKNLLRGSLENHIRKIEEGKSYAENSGQSGLEFYDNIHAIYTEGLAQLETKINLALASQNTISVDGFIDGMFSDMEKQAYEHFRYRKGQKEADRKRLGHGGYRCHRETCCHWTYG